MEDAYSTLEKYVTEKQVSWGVEILEVFDEIPGNMKSRRWEELAEELIKHRTGIYFKYLRK